MVHDHLEPGPFPRGVVPKRYQRPFRAVQRWIDPAAVSVSSATTAVNVGRVLRWGGGTGRNRVGVLLGAPFGRFAVKRITKPFFGPLEPQNVRALVPYAFPKTRVEHFVQRRSQLRMTNIVNRVPGYAVSGWVASTSKRQRTARQRTNRREHSCKRTR